MPIPYDELKYKDTLHHQTTYYNEELLYKLFGVNAELLIYHAWGYEPCTMELHLSTMKLSYEEAVKEYEKNKWVSMKEWRIAIQARKILKQTEMMKML